MKPYLLDINVLIALAWPSHAHHRDMQEWFAREKKAGFRTCPLTEIGFVRISCNPSFTPDAVSPPESCAMLSRITSWPGHGFWPDHLPFAEAVGEDNLLAGHRQVTDAYLLALTLFALLQIIGKPRFEMFHKSDVVQLVAWGLCFGFGFGVQFGKRKFPGGVNPTPGYFASGKSAIIRMSVISL